MKKEKKKKIKLDLKCFTVLRLYLLTVGNNALKHLSPYATHVVILTGYNMCNYCTSPLLGSNCSIPLLIVSRFRPSRHRSEYKDKDHAELTIRSLSQQAASFSHVLTNSTLIVFYYFVGICYLYEKF